MHARLTSSDLDCPEGALQRDGLLSTLALPLAPSPSLHLSPRPAKGAQITLRSLTYSCGNFPPEFPTLFACGDLLESGWAHQRAR